MGLQYRTVRAAASALFIAIAVGAGGMTGMMSVLAVDPAMVAVSGSLVDGTGAAIPGVPLRIAEELPPDGGVAAFQVTTGHDGSFTAELFAWGTTEAPASVSISTPANTQIELIGDACSETWGVEVKDDRKLPLAAGAAEPLLVTATTTLLGEVCGTTATPAPPDAGGNTGTGGGARVTPPPTDTSSGSTSPDADRAAPAITIGFLLGVLIAVFVMLPRRGVRRRS